MTSRDHEPFGHLLHTAPLEGAGTPIDPPRPVLVTGPTYDGDVVTLELHAVRHTRTHVLVAQPWHDDVTWYAWVPAQAVERR